VIAGRYSLEREIGRGGTGVVWLGQDEVLGRPVALKRIGLLPGADQTDLARAEREARLSARLNHPHVVAVFDVVVEAESGAHWLVMEYVDGLTLGQLVSRQGPLSPDEAAPLMWQAADALVAAHAAGIVHRDVKPSNILVERARQVKLTDFGIARIANDATLTQTGMLTGSPAYLAPEIATGGRSDEAADVWSLGATLFHVLAGRPPYEVGDSVLGALYRIVNEEPPRLTGVGWMAPLLEGTMVRDPSRRWSMAQVRDFLGNPLHHVPTGAAQRDTTATRAFSSIPVAAATEPDPPAAPPARALPTVAPPPRRRPSSLPLLLAVGLLAALVLAVTLYAVLRDGDPEASTTKKPSATASSAKPTSTKPTEQGMESFIRDYVAAVAADPRTSWQMLTPKFQQDSGGFDTYLRFWDRATNGRVLSISADPDSLTVSYQVRFDNFPNGPGPTVLTLKFEDGRYRIDGEQTQGFQPAD
jgi:serine/threonine protein kinase